MNNTAILPNLNESEAAKTARSLSCHRHHSPVFNQSFVNLPIVKRFAAILKKFDWHKCKPMAELRANGGGVVTKVYSDGSKRFRQLPARRKHIRTEREETLSALVKAIINNVEYSPTARYMYECMLSVEELAKSIGQLHEYAPGYDEKGVYRHGRKAYDPVLGALDDLEASKLVIVVREFDADAKQYKASRVFLTPLFFQSLGVTAKETKKLMAARMKYAAKNKIKYKRARPLSDKMANIDSRSLESLFNYHKRWYKGELEADEIESKRLEKMPTPKDLTPTQEAEREYRLFTNSMMPVMVSIAESDVKRDHPGVSRLEFFELVKNRLRH